MPTPAPSRSDAVSRDDIEAAAERIRPYVRRTPVISITHDGATAELKLEHLQVGGSFKARGAFNRLVGATPRPARVAAASGGNHGIAVALAARALGIAADIFVPDGTPLAKRAALVRLGATLHVGGAAYADAARACAEFAAAHHALGCHAYDQPEVLAGQGTVAREWAHQTGGLDTVLVAVGGGGLIGGIAAWFRSDVRVVAVESTGCPTLHRALAAGRPVDVDVSGIAADALGARRVGESMFPIAQRHVAASVLVDDAAIERARLFAWQEMRTVLEPGGAVALAAWLERAYRPAADERLGVLLCGANTLGPPMVDPDARGDSR